jgi:hypothetical protein
MQCLACMCDLLGSMYHGIHATTVRWLCCAQLTVHRLFVLLIYMALGATSWLCI